MKQMIDFLHALAQNNDRVWFNSHKAEYLAAKARLDQLITDLVPRINEFDPSIGPLTVDDCTWRIYRDTRFSKDKTPYKTHRGAFFAPQGKRGPYSGYYFQIGVGQGTWQSKCMLCAGNYISDPKALRIIREDIEADEGEALFQALEHAKGYELDFSEALKRVPRGFPVDKPYSDILRLKNFCICKVVDEAYMSAPDLAERLVADFRLAKPFLDFINRAINYSLTED